MGWPVKFPGRIQKEYIVLICLLFLFVHCTKPSSRTNSKRSPPKAGESSDAQNSGETLLDSKSSGTSSHEEDLTTLGENIEAEKRAVKVSAYTLDQSKFLVRRFTIGLADFLKSQTPVLQYDTHPDVDYVEIIRCPADAKLNGTVDTVKLADLELNSIQTEDDKERINRIYKNNDFFKIAMTSPGCSQITEATIDTTFYDSWAPSGSYRYLIRTCISPQRLIDTNVTSTRSCSRQIGVTSPLTDYVNTRDEASRKFLKESEQASSKSILSISAAGNVADDYACYLQWCQCGSSTKYESICERDENDIPVECKGGEHGRAVALAKKKAITTLVAVAADIALSVATADAGSKGGFLRKQSYRFRNPMDLLGHGASLNGMTFDQMFQELMTQTQDFPRSCGEGISRDLQLKKSSQEIVAWKSQLDYYDCKATLYDAATTAAAGEDISIHDEALAQCPAPPAAPGTEEYVPPTVEDFLEEGEELPAEEEGGETQ